MSIYNCPTLSTIDRTKGASLFALDIKVSKYAYNRHRVAFGIPIICVTYNCFLQKGR